MPSEGDLIEGFPHPTLTPVIGIPTYESLAEVNLKLNANAASVHSNLGDGAHGLLPLTIDPAVYATISNTPFIAPANPGPQPDIPAGATTTQIAELTCHHTGVHTTLERILIHQQSAQAAASRHRQWNVLLYTSQSYHRVSKHHNPADTLPPLHHVWQHFTHRSH